MREPGGLTALGAAGANVWTEHVRSCIEGALADAPESRLTLGAGTGRLAECDWPGLPARVSSCLGRDRALELLDWEGDGDEPLGGRALQEDYIEWRVVTDPNGVVRRVECTTELADYWCVLAGDDPSALLETIAEFADEASIPPSAVYGPSDPFAPGVGPEERAWAFALTMLPPLGRSPYNSGRRAMCCMSQPTNTLAAIVQLAVAATSRRVARDPNDGRLRQLTSAEAIPLLGDAAVIGRASDPILVERLGRLAFEGRRVAFEDPLGVYMQSVEHTRLRTPSGDMVPLDWFTFSRGLSAESSHDGRPRYQRLSVEVPPREGFVLGDVIDVATEQPIRHGGQVAEFVQLAIFLRAGDPDPKPGDLEPVSPKCKEMSCEDIRGQAERFLASSARP
jgi:hypothetical protein